jgi:hypothetical protein
VGVCPHASHVPVDMLQVKMLLTCMEAGKA